MYHLISFIYFKVQNVFDIVIVLQYLDMYVCQISNIILHSNICLTNLYHAPFLRLWQTISDNAMTCCLQDRRCSIGL